MVIVVVQYHLFNNFCSHIAGSRHTSTFSYSYTHTPSGRNSFTGINEEYLTMAGAAMRQAPPRMSLRLSIPFLCIVIRSTRSDTSDDILLSVASKNITYTDCIILRATPFNWKWIVRTFHPEQRVTIGPTTINFMPTCNNHLLHWHQPFIPNDGWCCYETSAAYDEFTSIHQCNLRGT